MNMHWLDWLIVLTLLAFMFAAVIGTKRYTRGVADFLAVGLSSAPESKSLINPFTTGRIDGFNVWFLLSNGSSTSTAGRPSKVAKPTTDQPARHTRQKRPKCLELDGPLPSRWWF